jgi:hypothetical protein
MDLLVTRFTCFNKYTTPESNNEQSLRHIGGRTSYQWGETAHYDANFPKSKKKVDKDVKIKEEIEKTQM